MDRYWSDLARSLSPYVPGEQPQIPDLIKLNTNESPFPPSPKALEAITAAATEALRLYPDPSSMALRRALARYHGVDVEQVFVGNGSDEVLAHVFAGLLKQARPLLFPDISYSFYPVYCQLLDIDHTAVPLDDAFRVRVDDYLEPALGGAMIIPNPNAPTGIGLSRSQIERLVAGRIDAPVVIDEAYVDFGGESAIPLVRDHPNLLVVQTFSKSRALAGLRVGYAIGDAGLIAALERVKDSFNSYPLGRPAQAGAIAAIEDAAYFESTRAQIIATRERLVQALAGFGFETLPSSANFVFTRHPRFDGAALAQALRRRAILVRHFQGARTAAFVRITIGSADQTERLIAALGEIVAQGPLDQ